MFGHYYNPNIKEVTPADIAAKNAKPGTYYLYHSNNANPQKPLRFFTLGCQGDAKANQLSVAHLMEEVANASPHDLPDFILLLGDNFYDNGVSSPNDPIFNTHFYQIYDNPKFQHLKKIPVFAILGNHDGNIHNVAVGEKGIPVSLNQVAHTYVPRCDNVSTESLEKLYQQKFLDLDSLQKWNMPNRYYSLIMGDTQIFCIDSNTYGSEFIAALGNDHGPDYPYETPNQAIWLKHALADAIKNGRKTILALHHPLVTPGKRAFGSDSALYLTPEEILQLGNSVFTKLFKDGKCSYNAFLNAALAYHKLNFDLVLAAHDHNMSYYNDNSLRQITCGGGGGPLQARQDFSNQLSMGCFVKANGFGDILSPQGKAPIVSTLLSVPKNTKEPGLTLQFTTKNCLATRIYLNHLDSVEIQHIQMFCTVVISAVNTYLKDFLADLQTGSKGGFLGWSGNLSHGQEGVERAHNIWNYVNHFYADDYATTIRKTHEMSCWTSQFCKPSKHSFITILNQKIAETYGQNITMESLHQSLNAKQNLGL